MTKIKQLAKKEIIEVLKLEQKEFEWVTPDEVSCWAQYGTVLGNEDFAVLTLPITAPSKLCQKVSYALQDINHSISVIIVPIGRFEKHLEYLFTVKGFIGFPVDTTLLLSIKPQHTLDEIFSLNYKLHKICPLVNLRPFYIFTQCQPCTENNTDQKKIPLTATYTIGKYLEQGYLGVSKENGQILLVK